MTNNNPQNTSVPVRVSNNSTPADSAFICWQSTGFTSESATLACSLANLHVQLSTFATQLQHEKEHEPEVAALKLQILNKQMALLEVRLETIGKKMELLQYIAAELGRHLLGSGSYQEFLSTASGGVAEDLEMLGVTDPELNNLSGWVHLIETIRLSLHNERLQAEHERSKIRDELEIFNLHAAFVQLLANGTAHLYKYLYLKHLSEPCSEYVQRGLDHLGQHLTKPLTKNWCWLLDEHGDTDDF